MSLLVRKRARFWVRRGNRARDGGKWPEAALAYSKSLQIEPRRPAIWVQYGHALKEAGFLADAEAAYRRSLALDRLAGDTFLQLGHVLKMQGRSSEAVDAYCYAYIVDHENPAVLAELASHHVDPSTLISLPKSFE